MIWKLLIVLLIVVIILGPGRISKVMEDLGKGVKGFKDGLSGDGTNDPKKDA